MGPAIPLLTPAQTPAPRYWLFTDKPSPTADGPDHLIFTKFGSESLPDLSRQRILQPAREEYPAHRVLGSGQSAHNHPEHAPVMRAGRSLAVRHESVGLLA